ELGMRELGAFAALAKRFAAEGVDFVAVCEEGFDPKVAAAAAEAVALAAPIAIDATAAADGDARPENPARGATAARYGVAYFPTTVVVDRAGTVRAAGVRLDRVSELLDELLAEPAP
ncbi:MAG: Thiol-disulfide oxidoreductase ResA, partial [Planctomycetota bacterium]